MKESLMFALVILLILATLNSSLCYEESVVRSIREVYSRLVDAEERGADVRGPALKLEKALELVRRAGENPGEREAILSEARALVEEVNSSIPALLEEAEKQVLWRNIVLGSAIASVALVGVTVYLFGARVFWETWLKARSSWVIELLERREKGGGSR